MAPVKQVPKKCSESECVKIGRVCESNAVESKIECVKAHLFPDYQVMADTIRFGKTKDPQFWMMMHNVKYGGRTKEEKELFPGPPVKSGSGNGPFPDPLCLMYKYYDFNAKFAKSSEPVDPVPEPEPKEKDVNLRYVPLHKEVEFRFVPMSERIARIEESDRKKAAKKVKRGNLSKDPPLQVTQLKHGLFCECCSKCYKENKRCFSKCKPFTIC